MADESGEWRFGIDDVGPDGELRRDPIEPESVDPENALFVALGIVGTVAVFVTLLL